MALPDLDVLGTDLCSALDRVHAEMLEAAKQRLEAHTFAVTTYADMLGKIQSGQHGLYLAPWACDSDNEAAIKADCKATIRCYPFDHNQEAPADGVQCFYSGKRATHYALFARAF